MTRNLIVQQVAVADHAPQSCELGPGDTVTFGRGSRTFSVDIRITDPFAPRELGTITMTEHGFVLVTNLWCNTFVVENPEGGGEYIKVGPGRTVPIPFEIGRIVVPTSNGPLNALLMMAPEPDRKDVPFGLSFIDLDPAAKYFQVLVALCEPRLRDPSSPVIPTVTQILNRLHGREGFTVRSIASHVDYLAREKFRLRDGQDEDGKADWQRAALISMALRHDLVRAEHLDLLGDAPTQTSPAASSSSIWGQPRDRQAGQLLKFLKSSDRRTVEGLWLCHGSQPTTESYLAFDHLIHLRNNLVHGEAPAPEDARAAHNAAILFVDACHSAALPKLPLSGNDSGADFLIKSPGGTTAVQRKGPHALRSIIDHDAPSAAAQVTEEDSRIFWMLSLLVMQTALLGQSYRTTADPAVQVTTTAAALLGGILAAELAGLKIPTAPDDGHDLLQLCDDLLKHSPHDPSASPLPSMTTTREAGMPDIPTTEQPQTEPLTGLRRSIILLLAAGNKDEQIARATGVSVRTVRGHIADMMFELNVSSRFCLGAAARDRGWIPAMSTPSPTTAD